MICEVCLLLMTGLGSMRVFGIAWPRSQSVSSAVVFDQGRLRRWNNVEKQTFELAIMLWRDIRASFLALIAVGGGVRQ